MTISARIRATVKDTPLTRDQIVNIVGGNRKARLHYIAKLLDRGMLVRVQGTGRDCLLGPGRDPFKDFALTPEERASRLKARNDKHNALKRERRLAASQNRPPRPPVQTREERRAKENARMRAKRAAIAALRPPKPPKGVRVRAKYSPAPRLVHAAPKPKPPGLIDCAKAKPEPPKVRAMTSEEWIAQGGKVERIETPPPSGYGVCPVRQRVVGMRAAG